MPECVILVGLPGAGKTTFYRQRLSATHAHVSKDLFPPSAKNKQSRQDAAIRAALASGQSVAVDNTNVTAAERAAIIAIARTHGARIVVVYIDASTREAVGRNQRRSDDERVPKVAIFTKAKRLEPPQPSEGYDQLHVYHVGTDGTFEEGTVRPPAPPPLVS